MDRNPEETLLLETPSSSETTEAPITPMQTDESESSAAPSSTEASGVEATPEPTSTTTTTGEIGSVPESEENSNDSRSVPAENVNPNESSIANPPVSQDPPEPKLENIPEANDEPSNNSDSPAVPESSETPMDVDQSSSLLFSTSLKEEEDANNDAADALATLASAALGQDQALKQEMKPLLGVSSPTLTPSQPVRIESSPWCDVGIIKGTSCVIKHFLHTNHTNEHLNINADNLPNYANCQKIELLPGTAYKFRVCAINAYGRGEWSDVSAFKTCLPGFPGAPSSIKISKSAEGAHLSWEPPPANSGKIIEYSVCLAVRNATVQSQGDSKTITSVPGQLAFVRVYCGPQNQAVVYNSSLAAAHIDTTAKPAIIFRIAAKNDKGYGPATQVRWLQDSPTSTSKAAPSRREKSQNSSSKKYKTNSY